MVKKKIGMRSSKNISFIMFDYKNVSSSTKGKNKTKQTTIRYENLCLDRYKRYETNFV